MTSLGQPLRLLLIEDSDADAELIQAELRRHGFALSCVRVQTEPALRSQFDLSLSIKTVSTYRTRLLRKLKLGTTAELIRYAIHEGLVH